MKKELKNFCWGILSYFCILLFQSSLVLYKYPYIFSHFAGRKKVDIFTEPSIKSLIAQNEEVHHGGWWKPETCKSWQKVAIIIPYRDRWKHLKILLKRLHPMLIRQQVHYRIFVIEQVREISSLLQHYCRT